ncbi:DUF1713 domain-containing protein [Histoplasma capsulatum var. duboisii H88]|uniref:Small ribosomal subunit protein mS38 n=2 Tax=Ajellomyces capsulatus TaxID=5037 RepID=F0UVN7_AJEC8|nr:DUF1713 domain-containing protein [Histoplasma capsulatum H143]EGC49964.1 DUF1713 domain-containing protein [Histoplasma capsulatum var. duboisii H88]QSS50836.1 DUF1713 domain-containing protein [Histoplasma capsulatum var. duboisii H88]
MFPSSARFLARSSPVITLPPPARPSTAVGRLSRSRSHQRRYSSSKPPVPPSDGSRGIDTSSQSPTKSVSPSNKEGAEKREGKPAKRRGGKDSSNVSTKSKTNEPFLNLPSVPSTQHLHPHDIHVASFFSTHRPISVTTSVPSNSNPDAFDAIFSSKKSSKPRPNDVIYTLSSVVNSIEGVLPNTQSNHPVGNNNLGNAISQGSAKTVDSDHFSNPDDLPMDDLRISIQDFAKKLRPFNPPPPPVPMESFGEQDATLEAETTEAAESELQEDVKEQSYSTLLTITESTHGDGRKTYEAHSSPLVRIDNKDAPSSSVYEGEKVIQDQGGLFSISEPEMNRHRQQHRVPHSMGRKVYYAISVKRQRKLKMKKHKHKKLMRRTRTLRRKLDKA